MVLAPTCRVLAHQEHNSRKCLVALEFPPRSPSFDRAAAAYSAHADPIGPAATPLRERAGMEKPPGCLNSKAASSGRTPPAPAYHSHSSRKETPPRATGGA